MHFVVDRHLTRETDVVNVFSDDGEFLATIVEKEGHPRVMRVVSKYISDAIIDTPQATGIPPLVEIHLKREVT